MFSLAGTLFVLPALVVGQVYGPPPGPAPGTTTAAAAVSVPSAPPSTANQINIDVAFNGNFVYNPANVSASPGSTVTFFFPGGFNRTTAHSVTQSSFENPCTYLTATGSDPAGFDSGLVLASTFTLNITDDQPIYFHCKQVTHCGLGMVGTINAPSTGNTFDAFMSAAMSLGANAPTDDPSAVATGGVHGVATAAPSSDTGGSSGGTASSATTLVASSFAALSVAIVMLFA
ncbi:putative GPI-anchored cupredoxin [Psilocybe cubensis]|uniref:GPI-anchored cupredoxin n=2 Tax=Psilocybe cubensis TaxID=181762 RepID=A0ACB8H6W3_PSICU|nr:putative GPI-anchored cupredoxin [Psilocybe cubensis]KAH9483723.1 putative GPI-anchored cupredoxin [Psilocybe cubensis]